LGVFPISIVRVGSFMPVLTAQMLNIWYPVAYFLKEPGAEVWTVSSKISLLPHIQVRFVALVTTVAVIAHYVWVVARSPRPLTESDRIRYILTFATLIVPAIMTSSHENHLFLATVLFVPLLGSASSWSSRIAMHVVLLTQAINLEGIYGRDRFALWLQPSYSFEWRTALSLVSIGCFLIIGRELYRQVRSDLPGRAAILVTAGG
jgi:hypothetical protein